MHSIRHLDHHHFWEFSAPSLAPDLPGSAFMLAGARGLSTAGDIIFRIVAALGAFQQTNSAALTGLILVLPGIAGMLCRGRLSALLRYDPIWLLVGLELLRAALFGLLPIVGGWITVLVVMASSGALQAIYEGAFAGMIQTRFDAAHIRQINGFIRLAMVLATLGSLVAVAFLHLSVFEVALFNGLTFVISAGSCVLTGRLPVFDHKDQQASEAVTDDATAARKLVAISYFGAAFGLALSAPSIVQICISALHDIVDRPIAAYAVYEAAIVVGSSLGILLAVRLQKRLLRLQILSVLLAINGAMVFGTLGYPALFLAGALASALAEMAILIDLLSRYQLELVREKCEEETLWFRSMLAIISAVGFGGNLLLQGFLDPIPLLFFVSVVGLGATTVAFALNGGRSVPVSVSQVGTNSGC